MFYSINGNLIDIIDNDTYYLAIVECGGIGYSVKTTKSSLDSLAGVGNKAFFYTFLYVRDDSIDLFGFTNLSELNCFKMLISVSGIGPKVGLCILSSLKYEEFAFCVASNDSKKLTSIKGIGSKIAQRIVLELKDKINKNNIISNDNIQNYSSKDVSSLNISQARDALSVLGYSSLEINNSLKSIQSDLSVEDIIKHALKKDVSSLNISQARDALSVLGYSSLEINNSLKSIQSDLSVEDIIKHALKLLAN